MNLNDMLVFAEVVERGGFTAAGTALGIPKSSISRTVSRLEKALGVGLLERTTRRQTLTEIGRIYYQHCQRIKQEIAAASTSIEGLAMLPAGRLRVGASVTVGQGLIAPHLADFSRRYPQIEVDLRLTNRRVDLIDEGYDLVIRVGELPSSGLISKYLCSPRLQLYASKAYLAANNQPLAHPEDLQGHRCLFMSAMGDRSRWQLRSDKAHFSFEFEPAHSCDDFYVLRYMAEDGLGIVELPDYLCRHALARGRLVNVLPDWAGEKVDIHALVPSRRGMTPKIRVFLDHLTASCYSA